MKIISLKRVSYLPILLVLALIITTSQAQPEEDIDSGTGIKIVLDRLNQKADLTLGDEIQIPVNGTITLSSNIPTTLKLTIRTPFPDWQTYISPTIAPVPAVNNYEIDFNGWIRIPIDSPEGEHEVQVRAEGQDDWLPIRKTVRSTVRAVQNRVRIETDSTLVEAQPGDNITFGFTVYNDASIPDTFSVITEPSSNDFLAWEWYIQEPTASFSLGPDESTDLTIKMTVPENTSQGIYSITVQVSSDSHFPSKIPLELEAYIIVPEVTMPFPLSPGLLILIFSLVGVIGMTIYFTGTEVGIWALLSFLVMPLYSRIQGKKVLNQFTRGQIYGYIKANAGVHFMAIMNDLDLQNGTLAYHLRVLVREGLIITYKDGFYRRFYPKGTSPQKRKFHPTRIQKDIINEIRHNPGITQKYISKILKESKQVVNYHIKILSNAGMVRLERGGKETYCFLTKEKQPEEEWSTGDVKPIGITTRD
jgi:predicted transcriptional regulator